MCTITLLGPKSAKYHQLKQRIGEVIQVFGEAIEFGESQDLNDIVEAHIQVVPAAIVSGEEEYMWTLETDKKQMMLHLLNDRSKREHACKCGGGCKKKKKNPDYTCHH